MIRLGVSMSTYEPKMGPITFAKGSLEEKLAQIHEIGYTGIDLFCHKVTDRELCAFKERIDSLGLEISLFIPFYLTELNINLSDPDGKKRKANVKTFIEQFDVARFLGATKMPIGYQRGRIASSDTLDNYRGNLAESLTELGEAGKKKGVTMCFEPINFTEMNTFYTSTETLDYLREYKLDDIMLLLDSCHIEYERISQAEAIEYCRGRIAHYHVSDTNRLPVGQGRIDFKEVLIKLKEIGYDGYVSMESTPTPTSYDAGISAYGHLLSILNET